MPAADQSIHPELFEKLPDETMCGVKVSQILEESIKALWIAW